MVTLLQLLNVVLYAREAAHVGHTTAKGLTPVGQRDVLHGQCRAAIDHKKANGLTTAQGDLAAAVNGGVDGDGLSAG